MARNETFVTAYRLQVNATLKNLNIMEDFVEAISDCAIVSNEEEVAIIVASSDVLGATKLANMALKFFGKERYSINKLGLLGPFKK